MRTLNKSAFTMIELVFVIVIIGILAAVALPKLQAVKDDATKASINEAVCLNLKSQMVLYSGLRDGSLVGFSFDKYSDVVDGTNITMTQSGSSSSLVVSDLNDVNSTSLKATLGNESNSVYVYLIDGNKTIPYSCLIGNSPTSTKSASEARTQVLEDNNYL